jgi:hypothetical protein
MVPPDEDNADKSDNGGGAAQHSAPHCVAAAGVGSLARLVREIDLKHQRRYVSGLRIRIHFIQIRIKQFRLNTDPDPGL